MPDNLFTFYFDPNFSSFSDGVFTNVDKVNGPPPLPPIEGLFLELNGGDFLLLNGEEMALL